MMKVTQEKINLNSADLQELQQVPGIGEVMAKRIIQARPFANLDDLKNVSGIGPVALEQILPYLTIASEPDLALLEPTQFEEPAQPVQEDTAQADEAAPEIAGSLEDEPQTLTTPTEYTPAQPEDSLPGITPDAIEEATPTANKETPLISPPPQPTSQRDVRATRSQVIWTAFGFSLLAVVFALITNLGLLVLINGGLSYARPVQLSNLNHQVENLTTQLANLEQSLESLNTRIDNLEGISGRIKQIETTNQQLQEEVNTASESVRSLETQISEIEVDINNLEQTTSRFQNFLDGLKELLTLDESP
jgi:competence ComEA-like helix-hairpin-helix protein